MSCHDLVLDTHTHTHIHTHAHTHMPTHVHMECELPCGVLTALMLCPILGNRMALFTLSVSLFLWPFLFQVINDANNSPHVAFYAKSDLKAGKELTFDYR